MTENSFNKILRYLLFSFFLSPLIYVFYKFGFQIDLNFAEVFFAIKSSLVQSGLASFVILVLATPMAISLVNLSESWQEKISKLLLLPQILPVLFTVLIVFSLLNPFPKGSVGITILFITLNLGLVTVFLRNAIRERIGRMPLIAEISGLTRLQFMLKIFLPLMSKDMWRSFFIVFSFCFSSFSIPIVAGDGRNINLEILIYEKIFIDSNWVRAFSVSLLQILIIYSWTFLLTKNKAVRAPELKLGRFLNSQLGKLFLILFLGLYLGGFVFGIIGSISSYSFLLQYQAEIWSALVFSFKTLSLYLVFSILMLGLWLWDYIKNEKFNPALNLFSISTIVVGFSFYLLFPTKSQFDSLKLILAFTILSFPVLFKLFLEGAIESLNAQIKIAQLFGLSPMTIMVEIIIRQLAGPMRLWFVVSSMWFASDYAVSKAVGLQTTTLGLLSESFLNSYRLNSSYLVTVLIIFFVLIYLLIFNILAKVLYVSYKKLAL